MSRNKVVEIPCDGKAERLVLGCVLNSWGAFGELSSFTDELFYYVPNRVLFQVLRSFYASRHNPSLKDIWHEIERREEARLFDGYSSLRALQASASGSSLGPNLDLCRQAMQRRQLLSVADDIFDRLHKDAPDVLINDVAGTLSGIYQEVTDKTYTLAEVLKGAAGEEPLIDQVEREYKEYQERGVLPMKGPSIGIKALDEMTMGLAPGSLIGIGANTGIGKSDFIARIIYNLIDQQVHHMVFTLEMSAREYSARLHAIGASIQSGRYLGRKFNEVEMHQIRGTDGLLRQTGKYCIINDNTNCTPEVIQMKLKRELVRNPVKVVIVDHLGLIQHDNPRASDYERMGHSSRMLKTIAMQHGVCVLEAAQFNRASPKDEPSLASFRDCGKVEEDMDNAYLLSRPNYGGEDDFTRISVAKNRIGGGRLGKLDFTYNSLTGEWTPRKTLQDEMHEANRRYNR